MVDLYGEGRIRGGSWVDPGRIQDVGQKTYLGRLGQG